LLLKKIKAKEYKRELPTIRLFPASSIKARCAPAIAGKQKRKYKLHF
jgi:hypothetical protein